MNLQNNKTLVYVPKYDTEVVIEFEENCSKINVEYIPNECYTEQDLNKEVRIIIKEMLKLINKE